MTPAVRVEVAKLSRSAATTVEIASRAPLANGPDYALVAKILATVKRLWEKVDTARRSWVEPLGRKVAALNNAFRPSLTALEKMEKLLKERLVRYRDSRPADLPEIPGLSFRTEWTGKVVDAALIPPAYLVPDEKALRAITKAKGADPGIPGWSASPEQVVSVEVGKIDP